MTTKLQAERNAMSERKSKLGQDFREVRAATKQLAEDSVDAVRETANDLIGEGRTLARETAQSAQNKVVEKPMKTIVIAAAFGFLCGMLVRRR